MAETRQTVRECYGLLNRNGRYIAASANSIPGYCKPQNVKALYDEIALLSCTSISPGKQELSSDS
jgi:hypothetical protein